MLGRDLAREVTPDAPLVRGEGRRAARGRARHRHQELDRAQPGRARLQLDADAVRHERRRTCSTREPDAVFLANGPGDPAALDYVVGTVRELVGKVPVFGICLGHQLLCRAVGLETFKLPFGHRGANHPVKDLSTGQDRDHGAEPRLRGRRAGRRAHRPRRRAGALGDRLRHRRALAPEPLRPHGRGPRAARRARRLRAVPPRGGPGAARLALPVRPVPGDGRAECLGATTSRRS